MAQRHAFSLIDGETVEALIRRQTFKGIAGQAKDSPVVERLCADALVEIDCELIPVEDCPFEPAAVSLDCDLRERGKQSKTNPFSSSLGADEKILEIDPALREKCRVVVKEESESNRLIIDARDDHFCGRPIGEKRVTQFFFRCDTRIAKSLVFRETMNELENQWNVRFDCGSNLNRIRQSPGPR